jgi:hypothetical protein
MTVDSADRAERIAFKEATRRLTEETKWLNAGTATRTDDGDWEVVVDFKGTEYLAVVDGQEGEVVRFGMQD